MMNIELSKKLETYNSDLKSLTPKLCEGEFSTNCCGKPFTYPQEVLKSTSLPNPSQDCPYCITSVVKIVHGKKTVFKRILDEATGIHYFQEPMKNDSAWARNTYINQNVKLWEPEFGMWMLGDKGKPGVKFEFVYKKTFVNWNMAREYNAVVNIMKAVNDFGNTGYGYGYGYNHGYPENHPYLQSVFGQFEIDFLRKHNLYEEFQDIQIVLGISFRKEVINSLEFLRTKMNLAGQALY